MSPWMLVSCVAVGSVALMALLFVWQRRAGDPAIVDVGWAAGVGLAASFYAWAGQGNPVREWMVLGVAGIWAARLAGYVAWRLAKLPKDGRYVAMQRAWDKQASRRMFRFYLAQAFGVVLFSIPILLALRNPQPLGPLDWIAALVGLAAIAFEWQADLQLSHFRRNPQNAGKVCQSGWWRYSRHPNYFFEWIHWFTYPLFAVSWIPWGWAAFLGPVLMWYFITQVTGIPPAEAQATRSRGDAYRRYQQTTNAFVPWFPRQSPDVGPNT